MDRTDLSNGRNASRTCRCRRLCSSPALCQAESPRKDIRTPGPIFFTNHCSSLFLCSSHANPQGPMCPGTAEDVRSAHAQHASRWCGCYAPRERGLSSSRVPNLAGLFRSSLVMFVGSYESAQNLCRGLEQGFGPRIFHLAHVLAKVVPDVAQHTPYLDGVVTRIALRVTLLVLMHKNPPFDGYPCLLYPLRA